MHGTVHEHLWYLGNIAFVTILTVVAYKICKIYEITPLYNFLKNKITHKVLSNV